MLAGWSVTPHRASCAWGTHARLQCDAADVSQEPCASNVRACVCASGLLRCGMGAHTRARCVSKAASAASAQDAVNCRTVARRVCVSVCVCVCMPGSTCCCEEQWALVRERHCEYPIRVTVPILKRLGGLASDHIPHNHTTVACAHTHTHSHKSMARAAGTLTPVCNQTKWNRSAKRASSTCAGL